jgi:hypothetical protein
LLTLGRKAGTKNDWEITGEELQQKIDGYFYRGKLGDETFHEFDSFAFEREGIKVSGGKGTMYIDYWRGKPAFMSFQANDMKYDYSPPPDLSYYQMSRILKQMDKYSKDVWFDAERMTISCSETDCEEILATAFKGLRDSTLDKLDDKVAHAYRESRNKTEERRKEYPMSGFRSYLHPERRWYNVSVKRTGAREHWAWLSYDSFAPREVEFSVSRLGDWWRGGYQSLFSYYSKETRDSGVSPYDLEVRPDIDALDYDVLSVAGDVEIAVTDADTMACDLTYKVKLRRPVEVMDFAIVQIRDKQGSKSDAKSPAMRVNFIEDGNGEELTYIPRGGASGWVVLPGTMDAGDELTVHVKFTNKNSLYKLNPSYSYVSRMGWMPFIRFGDMINEFDLTIKVDDRYEILGVGHKVSDEVKGGFRTARFTNDSAVNFPTIIFGDYNKDTPKFAATKLDGTEIPVTIYVDRTSMMQFSQWKSREDAMGELQSGISEIRGDALRPLAEQAANALNLYREVYGVDYPFGKLDLVNDPIGPGFYGQAPASIIYLGTGVFRATGTVAHGGGERISKFKESVVAHETAHQWWGSLITMGNGRNYWFVESLAEYSSALFIENLYTSQKGPEAGRKAYLEKVEEWRREVLEAGAMAAVQDVDTMWSGGPRPGQARTAAIYNQGPYAFHVMRETFGDEKFFAFLKNLAQSLAGKEIVTRDIQMIAEQSFGGTMEWFFDQWIRGVGLPEYAFNYRTRRAEDGSYIVEGDIKQRIVVGLTKEVLPGKTFRGVVTINVTGKDKKEYPVRILVENETTPFAFKLPVEPREIALNENGGMLAHDVLVNRDF